MRRFFRRMGEVWESFDTTGRKLSLPILTEEELRILQPRTALIAEPHQLLTHRESYPAQP
ncbi:hypothetical protein [Streptomyces sp. NPDC051218]|uniref:hypothetical protein n=1 Tax=Streptomyces sp. NPDC051218 TaxID=3365645 RepID=UPI0037BBF189